MSEQLVQYFIVNEELKMGKGKIAAQVAHAATIYVMRTIVESYTNTAFPGETQKFMDWFNGIQTKVILKGPQSLLEDLEYLGYVAVRDLGLTQIAEDSLTVVTLGICDRDDVAHIVKDLPLL